MSGAGRRWLVLSVRSPSAGDRDALLADALIQLGARGVVERDGWFVAWIAEPDDLDALLDRARTLLREETGLDDIRLEHGWQDHEEWAESWKRGLHPRRIGARIVIHPSWEAPAETRRGDLVITLDPGMAFGTAEHGTTRGCLRLLEGTVARGDRLLDVGAGSGILTIAAVGLGAAEVIAVEGDPLACEAMRENLERNEVSDRVRVQERWADADALAALGPVEGVVANIETGLLRPLYRGFAEALSPGGWLIVSGILEHEWEHVRGEVEAAGFRFDALDADGEWRSGRFSRGVARQDRTGLPLGERDGIPAADLELRTVVDAAGQPAHALAQANHVARPVRRPAGIGDRDHPRARGARTGAGHVRTPSTAPRLEDAEALGVALQDRAEAVGGEAAVHVARDEVE
jgi:ribosomal protein L11 methyltransferase